MYQCSSIINLWDHLKPCSFLKTDWGRCEINHLATRGVQHITTQKARKGSVLADHLAHQAVEDYQSMKFEFLDEDTMTLDNCKELRPYEGPEQGSRWTLLFDGEFNALGNGISVVLISPEGCHTPFTARLCFNCTNNMAEYEACIFGLRAAIDLGIKSLDVFGDSALVISQIKGE